MMSSSFCGSVGVPCSHLLKNGGEIMKYRLIIFSLLLFSIFGVAMTQSELSVLKYQLQMPSIVGSALGFRMVGTVNEGAFGLVWKIDKKIGMFTGQVLGFNSVLDEWLKTGVFEWSRVYFDIYLLVRF